MKSNVMKTNNGKLLAAVAAIALIACCFVAVMPADDVDGVTSVPGVDITGKTTVDVTATSGDFYVSGAVTLASITATDIEEVNFYLGPNATLTLPASGSTGDVTTFNIHLANGFTDGKISAVDGLVIGGTEEGSYTAIENGIQTSATVDTTTHGIAVTDSTDGPVKYYAQGATIEPVTLSAASTSVVVLNGTVTINGAASTASTTILNTVSLENVVSSAGITVTGADKGTLTIAGTYTDGEITLVKGKATASSLELGTAGTGANATQGVLNAFASATVTSATLGATLSDLATTAGELNTIPATPYIYGSVATPASNELSLIHI